MVQERESERGRESDVGAALSSGSMVLYTVYKAAFWTKKGTYREYVGYTGNVSQREDTLAKGGSNWTKPLEKGTLKMSFLAVNIQSRAVARCQEALSAAKAILADREHVRWASS